LLDSNHQVSADIDFRFPFYVGVEYIVRKPINNLQVGVRLKNEQGIPVIFSQNNRGDSGMTSPGSYCTWVEIPGHLLVPGRYYIDLSVEVWKVKGYHYVHDCLAFDICQTNLVDGTERGMGVICPELRWFHSNSKHGPIDASSCEEFASP